MSSTKSSGPQRCRLILQQCLAIQLSKAGNAPEDFWMYDSGYMIFQVMFNQILLLLNRHRYEVSCFCEILKEQRDFIKLFLELNNDIAVVLIFCLNEDKLDFMKEKSMQKCTNSKELFVCNQFCAKIKF